MQCAPADLLSDHQHRALLAVSRDYILLSSLYLSVCRNFNARHDFFTYYTSVGIGLLDLRRCILAYVLSLKPHVAELLSLIHI